MEFNMKNESPNFQRKHQSCHSLKLTSVMLPLLLLAVASLPAVEANLWDNLWSNNEADRVVFPPQFELKLSWNATVGNQRSVNNTNYVQGHIKIDQTTNRLMMDTNFSTLSLAPQELVSYIIDFDEKLIYVKQKDSCKYFDIITEVPHKEEEHKKHHRHNATMDELKLKLTNFPNVAELFGLFPYLMLYNGTTFVAEKEMHEFKFSQPLGPRGDDPSDPEGGAFLAYFQKDTMDLDRIVIKAESLNVTDPFTLYASQPVRAAYFLPEDTQFQGVDCPKASDAEQDKINHYILRLVELAVKTH